MFSSCSFSSSNYFLSIYFHLTYIYDDLLHFSYAVVIIKVFLHSEQISNLIGTGLKIRYDIVDVLEILGVDFGTKVDQLKYDSG